MHVASDHRLSFQRVLLMAPYFLPCLYDWEKQLIRASLVRENVMMVFAGADDWPPCDVLRTIDLKKETMPGIEHDDLESVFMQARWTCLFNDHIAESPLEEC